MKTGSISFLAVTGILVALAFPARALSDRDQEVYRVAFRAAESRQWDEARRVTQQAENRLLSRVLDWIILTDGETQPEFSAVTEFMRSNPDWPRQAVLKRKAEQSMPEDLPVQDVLDWFSRNPPETPAGAVRHARALLGNGQEPQAQIFVRDFWVRATFGSVEEKDWLQEFGSFLTPADHRARLERLVWDDQSAPARRMLPLVDAETAAVAGQRLKFITLASDAEKSLSRLPENLRQDPGLLYDRVRWLRRKNRDEEAARVLKDLPSAASRPDKWWPERQTVIRRLMEKGDYSTAWTLAGAHGQTEGLGLLEAEFLAGWLALRKNREPAAALGHFERLYRAAATPISLSRGAYWAAQACEKAGRGKEARDWYRKAAVHRTAFYGQLAAQALNTDLSLPADAVPDDRHRQEFEARELVMATRLLGRLEQAAGQGETRQWAGIFLRHLGTSDNPASQLVLVAELAQELGYPDIAIAAAKNAALQGMFLFPASYPLVDVSVD
nr:lytic transglycosylase domain-containing protein [Pseudomonadota bacterium]